MELFATIDPRLTQSLKSEWERRRLLAIEPLPRAVTIALVGHRSAGKTTTLPAIAKLLGVEGVDLDAELARRSGRNLREWVMSDVDGFRAAERDCFFSLPRGALVACGGGFLSNHPDALKGCVAVQIPISFDTYRERLRDDPTRPRLRPELSIDDELREVYLDREQKHRHVRTMPFVDFLLAAAAGKRARRVVTLPPSVNPRDFAFRALRAGADLLEVRTDLIPPDTDLVAAARALPLLVSKRIAAVPEAWRKLAMCVDSETRGPSLSDGLLSFHANEPMAPAAAEAFWAASPRGSLVKHVEPLGTMHQGWRLLETQARLQARFGEDAVTVLATGELALPFRAELARKNALDFCALDDLFAAAPGQRFVADAAREARAGNPKRARLGIIGHRISHSRSPSIHPQPFDRIELPPGTDVGAFVKVLEPYYRGFAITSPFKQRTLTDVAVNTLWRSKGGYQGDNTDVHGAVAALTRLGGSFFTVLGEGGVADALAAAAIQLGAAMRFVRRADAGGQRLDGNVVWTWTPAVDAPEGLRLDGARVGVISYGVRGHWIAKKVREIGGIPVWLGARWFVAQARAQRVRWESAT